MYKINIISILDEKFFHTNFKYKATWENNKTIVNYSDGGIGSGLTATFVVNNGDEIILDTNPLGSLSFNIGDVLIVNGFLTLHGSNPKHGGIFIVTSVK